MPILNFQKAANLTEQLWNLYGKPAGEKLPPADKHCWTYKADGPRGEWHIDSQSNYVELRYEPVHPDLIGVLGEEGYWEALRTLETRLKAVKEYARDHRAISFVQACFGTTVAYAFADSCDEAMLLAEGLERGSDGLPDYRDLLTEQGFVLQPRRTRYSTQDADYESWTLKVGGRGCVLLRINDPKQSLHGDISVRYDTGRYVYTIVGVRTEIIGEKRVIFPVWPEAARDLRPIVANVVREIIERRRARTGVRFNEPLGGRRLPPL